MRFMVGLPLVAFTRNNRTAYALVGRRGTRVFGANVTLSPVDAGLLDEIVLRKCYNPTERLQIKEESVVVDAGANIGIFTIYAALRAKSGVVYSIEPEKSNFHYLKENVESNHLTNVIPINKALSVSAGQVKLHIGAPGSNTTDPLSDQGKGNVQTVMGITLTNLIERYSIPKIDFLKMDIEGAEFAVFSDNHWMGKVNALAMEVHRRKGSIGSLTSQLRDQGFSVNVRDADKERGLSYLYAWK